MTLLASALYTQRSQSLRLRARDLVEQAQAWGLGLSVAVAPAPANLSGSDRAVIEVYPAVPHGHG